MAIRALEADVERAHTLPYRLERFRVCDVLRLHCYCTKGTAQLVRRIRDESALLAHEPVGPL
ncbi:MAG TPA: hypothetical protein VGC70_09930 [Burkholderiales bacterium]